MLATNQPAAVSNLVQNTTGVSVEVPNPDDPVEKAYQALLEKDDAAQREIDRWIQENQAFAAEGADTSQATLALRIEERLKPVQEAYEDFLRRHPEHVRARLAYGSFLGDIGQELQAKEQWEKARELDPENPAAWNNLGNYYGHRGPVKKAFEYYAKAIEINPAEPVYYQNLATTVYLFRKDAKEYYELTEKEVFDKALGLYEKALELDPENFVLASDLAQSYYGIKPMRTEAALEAWRYALKVAGDESTRQSVYIHLARINIMAGRTREARRHLEKVTLPELDTLKDRLMRNLNKKEDESA
jgi:tetratricopeptide (TPR) repeat protein